jgi:hypothetical protein
MEPISLYEFNLAVARCARGHGVRVMLEHACQIVGIPLPLPRSLEIAAIAAQRHLRMAQLLATDPELVRRREKLGEGNRLLSEAARRAIKEDAQPSEIDATGKPHPKLVKRLAGSFPYFMFNKDAKRGWNEGLWF